MQCLWSSSTQIYSQQPSLTWYGNKSTTLTPPGARRVDEDAWKTFGGSFPTFEYVITDEELNEWLFSWNAHKLC